VETGERPRRRGRFEEGATANGRVTHSLVTRASGGACCCEALCAQRAGRMLSLQSPHPREPATSPTLLPSAYGCSIRSPTDSDCALGRNLGLVAVGLGRIDSASDRAEAAVRGDVCAARREHGGETQEFLAGTPLRPDNSSRYRPKPTFRVLAATCASFGKALRRTSKRVCPVCDLLAVARWIGFQ
jgi:hypothetical protein